MSGIHVIVVAAGSTRLAEKKGNDMAEVLLFHHAQGLTRGIGDFADLGRLTRLARGQGAGFVMVNPLHSGSSIGAGAVQQPSPY